ncbi:MAG: FprA family A-type flavoprotein, partial [Ruthenibacterium sp.]
MGAILAKENIWYVGVQDKNLRTFDIIMHSDYGTSYNAYLVKGKTKNVLFETSKLEFCDEFLENIKEVINPAELDYIVVNHTEPDHTGSMRRLLALAPRATVLGSNTALTFLKEIVNEDFPCRAVTEADVIDIGGMSLHFLSVPMLHWPDSMYTYIPEAKALFTCDSFGCHYADDKVFNDLIHGDFTDAYAYYFKHI